MAGARPPTTRRRSAWSTCRHAASEPSRRPALGRAPPHAGPGRRPIEVSKQNFFAELKRRNVVRMAGLYLVGAWLLTQVSSTVLPMFGAPDWLPRSIVILLAIGSKITMLRSEEHTSELQSH